ncbi:(2Fe-2S)-binding protein [Bosea sp. CRIB-10]|uniref:(2Fe-2S)-binding protein n=1 Tax=Bosea sp. CRIB-10 TaxID=378404 RepID=UPI000B84F0A2|nr:(2Fe-2S)-binding protein [Bosea sp. CRIB-10]
MFDFIVRRVEQVVGARPPVADALTLMAARRLPDGRPNRLFDPVRYPEYKDGPTRLRRVCCIRYLIPELGYCSTCPLPDARRRLRRTAAPSSMPRTAAWPAALFDDIVLEPSIRLLDWGGRPSDSKKALRAFSARGKRSLATLGAFVLSEKTTLSPMPMERCSSPAGKLTRCPLASG